MKALVCILLLLETFVFVVQQQVDGGLNENEISQQISSEDGRQNPPQTDNSSAEVSNSSQQTWHLGIPDIHAALRELTAAVTEQKEKNRELTTTITEQKENIRELTATVTEQKEKNRELTTTITEQKENIRELTASVTEQKENISELTVTVTEQKENISELTATVTEQKENISELTASVTEQKENISELTATVTEQKTINGALETRLMDAEKAAEQHAFLLEELKKKNEEISNLSQRQVEQLRKENRDRQIAFSTSLLQSGSRDIGPFKKEITLTYRNVFTNIGNAYNPSTGIFTAPVKGVYVFKFSVYAHGSKSNAASAYLMKNGRHAIVAYAKQVQGALNSSKGVVLILEVGDVVYVRLRSGGRIQDNGNNHNTFSGYILFPLR